MVHAGRVDAAPDHLGRQSYRLISVGLRALSVPSYGPSRGAVVLHHLITGGAMGENPTPPKLLLTRREAATEIGRSEYELGKLV